jgi:hypothetical protein
MLGRKFYNGLITADKLEISQLLCQFCCFLFHFFNFFIYFLLIYSIFSHVKTHLI